MDTPKREVCWLESFPPEIWASFVWYIPGEQLGRLIMAGATSLTQRLKSLNVVKSIILGRDSPLFKSLPRFLHDFPCLQELFIHSPNDDWSCNLAFKISSIPSGMRKLELSGFWNACADKLFKDNGATLKLNHYLPHLEVLDFYSLIFANYLWMTQSPKSLTNLSLGQWDGKVALPTSLIHFKAHTVTLGTRTFVSKLPPSLETFTANVLQGVDLLVPLLPPLCRQFDIDYQVQYSGGPGCPQKLLEQLPKALTSLRLPESTKINLTYPEVIFLLPSTLTNLNIAVDLPCSVWPLLPQSLTNLSFPAPEFLCTVVQDIFPDHGARYGVKSIPFDRLPRSITKLELREAYKDLYFCSSPSPPNQSHFPPHLTSLRISEIQLSPETAKLLPSSLTYLELGYFCERVCEHLPNRIQKLVSLRTLLSPNLIKFLPKSLTSLHLSIYQLYEPWFDHNTGKSIDPISDLAEYSIHEKCMTSSFDWKDASPLPRTLTYFVLGSANELGDSFLSHQQLPYLLDLNMRDSKHFTDLSIPLLSPILTTLDLSSSATISGKSFYLLPRCLTFLGLSSSESIYDSDIHHLPRTLKYANLNHAIHLTDLCIPDLPPHLESLYLNFNAHYSFFISPLSLSVQISTSFMRSVC